MVWYRLKTAGALVIATVMLIGCADENDGNPVGPVGKKVDDYSAVYKIAGDKIVFESQSRYFASNYCDDSVLIHQNDTSYDATDTMKFNLNGDTLRFLYGFDTLSNSKAIIENYTQMIRKGSGTGLVGVWTNATYGYNVVSGVLTSLEQKQLDPTTQYRAFGITYEYEFTPTQYVCYISGEFDYAAAFVYLWNYTYFYDDVTSTPSDSASVKLLSSPSDSARYDVTVKQLSSKVITLTGNKTNEVVTLTWDVLADNTILVIDSYKEIFTSSNTEHSTYTYYSDPISCPNYQEPSWYNSFLDANKRADNVGLAKRSIHSNRLAGSNHSLMETLRKPIKPF